MPTYLTKCFKAITPSITNGSLYGFSDGIYSNTGDVYYFEAPNGSNDNPTSPSDPTPVTCQAADYIGYIDVCWVIQGCKKIQIRHTGGIGAESSKMFVYVQDKNGYHEGAFYSLCGSNYGCPCDNAYISADFPAVFSFDACFTESGTCYENDQHIFLSFQGGYSSSSYSSWIQLEIKEV